MRRGGEGGKGAGKRGLGLRKRWRGGGGAVIGDKEIKRQTGKQTDRQTDRQTVQVGRRTGRQGGKVGTDSKEPGTDAYKET